MQRIITLLIIAGLSFTVSAQVPRTVLVEEFTNASCGPCAAQNPNFNALLEPNRGKVVPLKYQTPFPGYDPMNQHIPGDLLTRYNKYGSEFQDFTGVPTAFIDGILPNANYGGGVGNWGQIYSGAPAGFNQAALDYASGDSSMISVDVEHALFGQNDSIYIDLEVVNHGDQNIVGDSRLFVILIEKDIEFPCGAPGSNGETEFFDIAREFITGAEGVQYFRISAGDTISESYSRPIPEYIYNKSELGVVAFLQDYSNLRVYNADVSYTDSLEFFVDAQLRPQSSKDNQLCDPAYVPSVLVDNVGWDTIHNMRLGYALNGSNNTEYFTDLNLAPDSSIELNFDTISHPGGPIEIDYSIVQVNDYGRDANSMNDLPCFSFYAKKATDPLFEELEHEFENDPAGYEPVSYHVNADRELTFTVVSKEFLNEIRSVGYRSQKGVIVDFFNWPTDTLSQTAEMILVQRLDMSNIIDAEIRFDYFKASRQTDPSLEDSLALQYSLDCGDKWETLWINGGASMQTTRNRTDRFEIPQFSSDWEELEFPLDSLEGEADVMLRLLAINGGDNTLMLDNIEITGEESTSAVNPHLASHIQLYPNPLHAGQTVRLRSENGLEIHAVKVFDSSGRLIQSLEQSNVSEFELPGIEGMYYLQMQTSEGLTAKRLVILN